MPSPLPTVGFRAEFLIGFIETDHDNFDYLSSLWKLLNDGGPPPAAPPPLPDPLSQVIRLPVRSSPDSHDRVLLGAVVNAMGSSLAVSEFIKETDPIYPLLTNGTALHPPKFAKDQFWFTHRWFVASAATSRGHFVSPLVPLMINPPPLSGGRPLAVPPNTLPFSWRPVTVLTPVFHVSDVLPDMFTPMPDRQQDFAARLFEAQQLSNTLISAPMQSLRSSILTQLNHSCSFVVHVGLGCSGEEDDPYRLLTLKKMVTILWLGGEAHLAKLAGPKATTVTPLLTESAALRVRPNGFSGLLLNILDDDYEGSNAAFDKWLSPLLGPAPVLADVRRQVSQRSLADYALWQEIMSAGVSAPTRPSRRRRPHADNINGGSSSSRYAPAHSYSSSSSSFEVDTILTADPARRDFFFNVYGVNADVTLAHELFLLWRARDVDTIARLLTPYFWKGPSSVPLQHCAIDFVNLRNDVREERRSTYHPTICYRLFNATLDPAMVLAWTRLSAGLATQAAVSTPGQFRRICNRLLGGPKDGSISPGGSINSVGGNPATPIDHRGDSIMRSIEESPGGSSGNDGDMESGGNSSDSDDAVTVRGPRSPAVAPQLLIPVRHASAAIAPIDNWVAPPGLALPIAHPPNHHHPTPSNAIQAPADNRVGHAGPVLPIVHPRVQFLIEPTLPGERLRAGFTDTEGETINQRSGRGRAPADSPDNNHYSDTDGFTSDSLPYTGEEGEAPSQDESKDANEPALQDPGFSTDHLDQMEHIPQVNESENHGSGTEGWTSDSPPYTSAEEVTTSPMSGVSVSEASTDILESFPELDMSVLNLDGTWPLRPDLFIFQYSSDSQDGWTSDSLPYTTEEEPEASSDQEMATAPDEMEPSSPPQNDLNVGIEMDDSNNHRSDTDGWTSDSPPYTSDDDAHVDIPMPDSQLVSGSPIQNFNPSDGNDHSDSPSPPAPARATASLAASFEEDSEMGEPPHQSPHEGSPMDNRFRDNSGDLDVDNFDVWAFVRWLNVGREPLETLRQFVEVNNHVNPDDQPLADGELPFVRR